VVSLVSPTAQLAGFVQSLVAEWRWAMKASVSPRLRRGGVLQVVIQETDGSVRGDVDLWQEGLRVAQGLVDPNHRAPAQTAIGGLREGNLGGPGWAEPGVLPDRVHVAVGGLAANSGRKSLDRTACPAIDTDATCCTAAATPARSADADRHRPGGPEA
jgi:hypothetical protein